MVKGWYEDSHKKEKHPLYHYKIHNPHHYPVHLMISANIDNETTIEMIKKDLITILVIFITQRQIFLKMKAEEIKLDFYELYYNYKDEMSFYHQDDSLLFIVGDIVTKGEVSEEYIEKEIKFKGKKQKMQGILVKMEPQSEIQFSALLTKREFLICEPKNHLMWLGGVVKYPDLKIHQLLTDRLEEMPYENNLQHKLSVKAGKNFNIITTRIKRRPTRIQKIIKTVV